MWIRPKLPSRINLRTSCHWGWCRTFGEKRPLRSSPEQFRLDSGQRNRLFAQHVFARSHCRNRHRHMEVIGAAGCRWPRHWGRLGDPHRSHRPSEFREPLQTNTPLLSSSTLPPQLVRPDFSSCPERSIPWQIWMSQALPSGPVPFLPFWSTHASTVSRVQAFPFQVGGEKPSVGHVDEFVVRLRRPGEHKGDSGFPGQSCVDRK